MSPLRPAEPVNRPESGLAYFAQLAFDRGKLGEAEEFVRQWLRQEPDSIQALCLQAAILIRTDRISSAIKLLDEALSTYGGNSEALHWLSVAYRRGGDLNSAIDAGRRAVELSPANSSAWSNLGLAQLQAGDPSYGVDSFAKAVELKPRQAQFRHNLGLGLEARGDDAEAAYQFQAAISLAGGAWMSHLALGNLLLRKGNPTGAIECARRVLAIQPASLQAHLLAARGLSNTGAEEEAEAHLQEALRIEPENSQTLGMLGFRMQAVGRFEEANEFFRRSLKSNPEQGASYWGLIQGKRMGRDEGKEISTIIKVAENPHLALGERAYAYYSVGKIHADLGEYGSAMEFYDHANALTAKGRFGSKGFDASAYAEGIRRTTAIFSKEFIAGHQGLGTVSSTPIFIVGMMRSGTTLMEQILSSHPTVTAGGELRFWLERGPRAVDPQQGRIDPDLARRLIEDYEALLSRFSEAGHVTDKMPENAQMLGLIHTLFPNAKIIHMNRNPVDVCLSIYFTPYELSPVFGHVKENIVFAYRKHLELMDHWRTVLPSGAFLDVSYEELVDDSATTIRAVLDYCDLEWDEACLRHQENGRAVNTPSVWQVRQPIYKNSKEKWRNYEGCLGAFSGLVSSLK